MDPLSLLKDFHLRGRIADVATSGDGRVNFGGSYVFPLSANTAFQNAAKDYYTIEVVLFLLQNRALSHPEYIRQANDKKVGAVAFTDRKVRCRHACIGCAHACVGCTAWMRAWRPHGMQSACMHGANAW